MQFNYNLKIPWFCTSMNACDSLLGGQLNYINSNSN